MRTPLLKVQEVCKNYPGVRAVDHVSLDLYTGEVLGLMGENGAGKSTLIKILAGVEIRDSGRIYINGHEAAIDSPASSQENGINVIHQELITMDTLSVAENIFVGDLPLKRRGVVDWQAACQQSEKVLKKLHSNLNPKTIVEKLSVYEKQIVEIAKAIKKNSKILIMDEPTAALSEKDAKSLFEVIEHLKQEGVGIIYVSHRIEEVFEITDRITVMRDGKYIGTERTKSIPQNQIISMMIGRDLKTLFPERNSKIGKTMLSVRNMSIEGIIHDINFDLRAGEVLGLFGLVGSGCLNIARALYGLDTIEKGQVTIDGERVELNSPKAALRQKIGYLPIDRKLDGLTLDFSVMQNITLANIKALGPGALIKHSTEKSIAHKWVKELKIKTAELTTEVKTLSGGNQQKIVLAKILETGSKIFIIIEPTRGIDVGAKKDIYDMIDMLCETGASVLMISSEMPEILALADRILVVSNGKIRNEFQRGEVNQHELLHEATLN